MPYKFYKMMQRAKLEEMEEIIQAKLHLLGDELDRKEGQASAPTSAPSIFRKDLRISGQMGDAAQDSLSFSSLNHQIDAALTKRL